MFEFLTNWLRGWRRALESAPDGITPEQLAEIYDCPATRAAIYADHLNDAMMHYGIVSPPAIRAFLAQIGHESGRLRYVREIWGPTDAQRRYEGRADLGNVQPGDGERFRGRGLIQITGRSNYTELSDALGHDFVSNPRDLELPKWAAWSAAWFWDSRQLNDVAERGDFREVTRKINGGYNGLDDRLALHNRAHQVIA